MENVERPSPQAGEVIVRVERVGVCGTDLEILRGQFPATIPVTMGHEYAGVVAELGRGVNSLAIGAPVVSAAAWPCGSCSQCSAGAGDRCSDRRFLGSTADGAFAEFVAVPASVIFPLPDHIDADDGQSALAIAVCLRAVGRARLEGVGSVAISGPGHIGLLLLQLVIGRLGAPVTMFGTRDERLELAAELGATTVNVAREDWRSRADSFGVVFDCVGTPSSFLQSLELVAPGGVIVMVGVSDQPVPEFSTALLYRKEMSVIGCRGGMGEYQNALDALARNEVSAKRLISHRLPLADAEQALVLASDRERLPIRVVVEA